MPAVNIRSIITGEQSLALCQASADYDWEIAEAKRICAAARVHAETVHRAEMVTALQHYSARLEQAQSSYEGVLESVELRLQRCAAIVLIAFLTAIAAFHGNLSVFRLACAGLTIGVLLFIAWQIQIYLKASRKHRSVEQIAGDEFNKARNHAECQREKAIRQACRSAAKAETDARNRRTATIAAALVHHAGQ